MPVLEDSRNTLSLPPACGDQEEQRRRTSCGSENLMPSASRTTGSSRIIHGGRSSSIGASSISMTVTTRRP